MSNPYEQGRDSQARPGGGDTYKQAVPGGADAAMTYAGGDNLSEQDYRPTDEKAGPGRPNVTAPPSAQMQPEDQGRAGYPTAPGHGGMAPGGMAPGHGK
jgi:hypothetical protein